MFDLKNNDPHLTYTHFHDKWVANLLLPVVYAVLGSAFFLCIIGLFFQAYFTVQIAAGVFVGTLLTLWFLNREKIQIAKHIFIYSLLLAAIYAITITSGIHDTSMLMLPGIIVIAAIIFETRGFFVFSFSTLPFVLLVGIGQIYGIVGKLYPDETKILDVMVSCLILLGIIIGVWMLNTYLAKTMNALLRSEEDLMKSYKELEKRAEQIQKSEARWRSLVNNAPDFILNIKKDGQILFSNRTYPGKNPQEYKNISDFVPSEYNSILKDTLEIVFEKKEKASCEIQYRTPDGTYRWLSSHAAPIEEKGEIVSAIVIGKDITDMLELQEQLLQSQKMESIGNLAGGIAHDFNNLLTVINGHAQLAEMNSEKGKSVNEDIRAILEAGYRAANLTRQILAFSRKQIIQPENIDVKETIENFRKMTSMLIGEDIDLIIDADGEIPPIYADRNQFEQMIINLLVNARDAIYALKEKSIERKIFISVKSEYFDDSYRKDNLVQQSGPHVVVSVTDSGVGMSGKLKAHIFEPFFTTKETGEGTGLGLAMVYGMVKQNKGSIHVYSEPGKGTTFKIFWPAAKETKKISTIPDQTIEINGNECILIVEDDEGVRNFAAAALQTLGYKIFTQKNGNDAIKFFEKNRTEIDMVITDVIMPGMNGKEMADQLSAMKSDLKILFCSGYTDSYIQSSGILHEGIHFINKPYSTRDLALKVRGFLDEK